MAESAPLVNSFLLSTVAKASGESGASRLLLTSSPSRPRRSHGCTLHRMSPARELHHRLPANGTLRSSTQSLHRDHLSRPHWRSLVRLLNGEEANVDAEAVRLDELALRPLEVRPECGREGQSVLAVERLDCSSHHPLSS